MQAVSKGCQLITLPLPEPRWPFLSSFAGTAAHAGYCIILVIHRFLPLADISTSMSISPGQHRLLQFTSALG